MNILLIEDDSEARDVIQQLLTTRFGAAQKLNVVMQKLIQDGIELLEKQEQLFDLIVFAYGGTGQALVKCLLQYGGSTAYLMVAPDPTSLKSFAQPGLRLETAIRSELERTLPAALDRLAAERPLGDAGTPDTDFVPMKVGALSGISPIKTDIWIRLSENRYIKLIRKGSELSAEDFKKFKDIRRAELLYVRKADTEELMGSQVDALKAAAEAPALTEEAGDKLAAGALEAVANIVDRVGFTPKAQALAKASVDITLKLIGARPKLSTVLTRLQKEEGKYIASHSISLGKIACALAYKLGWNSAATYLKLTLAAFLHDLPLTNNDLASYRTLDEARKAGKFTHDELQELKLHPLRASEYAKQFHEIPGDVDQILFQHHERPDGTGFPRSLTHKYISPLGSIFIIAHDMLHFMLENPNAKMDDFFKTHEQDYNVGNFKKLFKQLTEADPPGAPS